MDVPETIRVIFIIILAIKIIFSLLKSWISWKKKFHAAFLELNIRWPKCTHKGDFPKFNHLLYQLTEIHYDELWLNLQKPVL